jgi:putative transposase
MQRKTPFAIGEHYHVYSRGVEKRDIFLDQKDFERFIGLLYITNQEEPFHLGNYLKRHTVTELFSNKKSTLLVSILGYCLMSNHFHLVLYEKQENGISTFMLRLLTAYSMYFNTKYKRSGPLFTRPFRSQHIADNAYYLYIFSYVHMNPLDALCADWKTGIIDNQQKAEDFLLTYPYSSYFEFLNKKRPQSVILDTSNIPEEVLRTPLNIIDYERFFKDAEINIEGSPQY